MYIPAILGLYNFADSKQNMKVREYGRFKMLRQKTLQSVLFLTEGALGCSIISQAVTIVDGSMFELAQILISDHMFILALN